MNAALVVGPGSRQAERAPLPHRGTRRSSPDSLGDLVRPCSARRRRSSTRSTGSSARRSSATAARSSSSGDAVGGELARAARSRASRASPLEALEQALGLEIDRPPSAAILARPTISCMAAKRSSCRSSSCPLVLLPGELVPLHIFEERYKRMIGHCLDDEEPFGIVFRDDDGARAGSAARRG